MKMLLPPTSLRQQLAKRRRRRRLSIMVSDHVSLLAIYFLRYWIRQCSALRSAWEGGKLETHFVPLPTERPEESGSRWPTTVSWYEKINKKGFIWHMNTWFCCHSVAPVSITQWSVMRVRPFELILFTIQATSVWWNDVPKEVEVASRYLITGQWNGLSDCWSIRYLLDDR